MGRASPFTGVAFRPERSTRRPWYFALYAEGRNQTIGGYATEKECAASRDRAVLYYGVATPLAFPREAARAKPVSLETLRAEIRAARAPEKTSRYYGVSKNGRNGRWIAEIRRGGITHGLGEYDREEDAAVAHDRGARHFEGKAILNFPELDLQPTSPAALRLEARDRYKAAHTTSFYRGVSWSSSAGSWTAEIRHDGDKHHIGQFPTEREAAEAVDRVARHLRLSPVNFPDRRLRAASVEQLRREQRIASKQSTASVYFGVIYDPSCRPTRPWVMTIQTAPQETTRVGGYAGERECAIAFDRAALHYMAKPTLNFPKSASTLQPADIATLREEVRCKYKESTASIYRGVVYDRRVDIWSARIGFEGRTFYLGTFRDEADAARAYDVAAARLHGDRARLNFPPENPDRADA